MAEHLEPLSVRAKTLQNISHISNAETTPTDSQQLNRKREKIAALLNSDRMSIVAIR
jgi:hypothetical protein